MFRFDRLVALYICCLALVELMGAKTFPLLHVGSLHLNASVAIFLVPMLFTITDVVVEVYGKQRARHLVRSGLGVIAVLFLFALLATHLPPSARFMGSEAAYDKIFGSTARIAAASLIAFGVSELLDVAVFARLRQRMHKRALWLRNNVSNFIGIFVDTTLFITLAFYSLDRAFGANVGFLAGLIVPYWLLKCVLSVLETPLVYWGVRWLRRDKQPSTPKLVEGIA